MNSKAFNLIGKDLKVGMHLSFDGVPVPIVDISEVDFHGMEYPHLNGIKPVCRPRLDEDIIHRYDAEMLIDKDGNVTWALKEKNDDK
jgi:hypothetical protein